MFDSDKQHPKAEEVYDTEVRNSMAYLRNVQPAQPLAQSSGSLQDFSGNVQPQIHYRPAAQTHQIPPEMGRLQGACPKRSGQRTGRGRSPKNVEFNFCLLPEKTNTTPVDEIKLLQAGLGRRKLAIADTAGHDEIESALVKAYLQMKYITGDWMLHKSAGGTGQRRLTCLTHTMEGYTGKYLKMNSNNGKHMLYIVPIQNKLDTSPLSPVPKSIDQVGVAMPLQPYRPDCVPVRTQGDDETYDYDVEGDTGETLPDVGDQQLASLSLATSCVNTRLPDQEHGRHLNSGPSQGVEGAGPLMTSMDPWKIEKDPHNVVALFRINLLEKKRDEQPLKAILDIHDDLHSQSSSIISFYRGIDVDWARPLHFKLHGDEAAGIDATPHFLSVAMSKVQHGFNFSSGVTDISLLFDGEEDHLIPSTLGVLVDSDLFVVAGRIIGHGFLHDAPQLHGLSNSVVHVLLHNDRETATVELADVPDLEIRAILQKLDGHADLTEEETDDVNTVRESWDLPPLSPTNRSWMLQSLLQREVIWRRQKQIKQLRRGLKDTKVLQLLTARPDIVPLMFPRTGDVAPSALAILSHVIWPGGAGLADDGDEDVPHHLRDQTTGFLRRFILTASPETLRQLLKFWVGRDAPLPGMKVDVGRGLYLKRGLYLNALSCFQTLHVPGHFQIFEDFLEHVTSCIATHYEIF